jgi:hypothetical protein
MRYIANPVSVHAQRIEDVENLGVVVQLQLENGTKYHANSGMTARYMPVPGDYLVTQDDGYQYLNPKEVFERKYRSDRLPIFDMSFSDAIAALKQGCRVAREGWNGNGMFLLLVPGSTITPTADRPLGIAAPELVGKSVQYQPHIDMFTAQGTLVPWVASQTDMLAEDWMVLPN